MATSTSGITFSGLSSGIDTDSIVKKLIELEQIPITRLQQRQSLLQSRMGVFTQFRAMLGNLSSAASALNTASIFSPVVGSSSDSAVATLSTSTGATEGTYSLKVFQLAQAQKLTSNASANTTDPLNMSGTFKVNGKSITVEATDTLANVASKINASGAGVTASLINGGTGQAYLTLTGNDSGAAKKIDLSDETGSVLSSLGFMGFSVRNAVTNGAASNAFTSATTALAQLGDFDGLGATSVTINGTQVSIDPSTDTLQSVATKLSAVPGVTATVVTSQEMGRTVHKLQVTGASTPAFGTEGNVFHNLGITKRSSELLAAQDGVYTLDTIAFTTASNNVSGTIPGTTFTLAQADSTSGKSTTLSIKRDKDQTKAAIKNLADAYNAMSDFLKENSAFDKETFATGLLFGDSVAQEVDFRMSSMMFENIPGLTGTIKSLSALGVSIDTTGKMVVNDATLDKALVDDPSAVSKVFRANGSASTSLLTFVSNSSKTVASGTGVYDVVITQAATLGSITASLAQIGPSTDSETLTFGGTMFSNSVSLFVPSGNTVEQTAELINADSRLKDLVTASVVDGKLKVESKRYGSTGNFTLSSDKAAAAGASGIGTAGESTFVTGLDVAGTINGETANGSGQFLTGNSGNAKTDGLQIQYTGTATGLVGNVQLTKGIASQVYDQMDAYLRAGTGLLSATDQSLQQQYDDLGKSVTDLQARLKSKEELLRTRFTQMEQAIAASQAQAARLSSMLGSSTTQK